MKHGLLLLIFAALPVWAQGAPLCSPEWAQWVEKKVHTGDGQGHGPDTGSEEWKSVVEFHLGIRGQSNVPERNGQAWCAYIDTLLKQGPSYNCDDIHPDSIEAMICTDAGLAAQDRKLAGIYQQALAKAANEQPSTLKAEQRGWIKGRNECWKNEDKQACVQQQYRLRTTELQARYRLVPERGPFRFACDGTPANEVVVTFYETEPATLIAEYGDSVSLMYAQPAASGSRYQGRNESFWEHRGETMIQWGYDASEMRCKPVN
ncbi:MliC family protein [Oceanimonas doudoroffii]|uniref:C-type lysozyme inhibitor domain-containing protein n=1 Tax=Oceanimonas doudoroffii TaxID=84158 RepID=A0A233RFR4_9GAMM|nr:MliC family protein [Oceanimonas doudoroffii]OXY82225.1 hypothetical protein B6S08_01415 [Oceanimonas doudoroffii]